MLNSPSSASSAYNNSLDLKIPPSSSFFLLLPREQKKVTAGREALRSQQKHQNDKVHVRCCLCETVQLAKYSASLYPSFNSHIFAIYFGQSHKSKYGKPTNTISSWSFFFLISIHDTSFLVQAHRQGKQILGPQLPHFHWSNMSNQATLRITRVRPLDCSLLGVYLIVLNRRSTASKRITICVSGRRNSLGSHPSWLTMCLFKQSP